MTTDYSPTSSGYGPAKRAAATPQQVAAAPAKPQSPMAVFFYIPNLIGYGRIIMMLASFRYMPTEPVQVGNAPIHALAGGCSPQCLPARRRLGRDTAGSFGESPRCLR